MMKKFLVLAVMAAVTVSCNTKIESGDPEEDLVAVGFSAYLNRGVTTRAGEAGELTTAGLQAATAGFGVFAYYTADEPYTGASGPSFMYNEKVTYDGSNWVYEPVKYWPNQFGAAASSEEIDKVTFFAYAPYVEATPSSGMVTGDSKSGIVALSRNSVGGDPMVKYIVNMNPGQGVDLCWGVSKNGLTASVDGNNNHVAAGDPYIDVVKLKLGDKIEYDFRHALSAVNVTIDAAVDATTAGTAVDANTRIYVRSVSFEGLATKGALNLNSTVANGPLWTDYSGAGTPVAEVLTVYDGRRDGKEGVDGAEARNETPTGLNPSLIQSKPYGAAGETAGVTQETVNLFNSTDKSAPVFVIPSNEALKVTIVYDVETRDDKLSTLLSDGETHGSTVENAISKSIQIGGSDFLLEAGKKYNIALHIGMTSVKFDATVSTWDDNTTGIGMDVPQNN
jgi:hypothetical protein